MRDARARDTTVNVQEIKNMITAKHIQEKGIGICVIQYSQYKWTPKSFIEDVPQYTDQNGSNVIYMLES